MENRGFALLEILIVVAILAAIAGGGFYLRTLENNRNAVQSGITVEQKASEAVQESASATQEEQDGIDQSMGK